TQRWPYGRLRRVEFPDVSTTRKKFSGARKHDCLYRGVGKRLFQLLGERHADSASHTIDGWVFNAEHRHAARIDLTEFKLDHDQSLRLTRFCPSSTSSPSATNTSTTVPPNSASTGSSIFMD